MQNRMTSRSRPRQGDTLPSTTTDQGPMQPDSPRLPHERDQSVDEATPQEPSGQRVGRAAHDDVKQGRVDTDKGPVLDRTYEKIKRSS